MKKGLFSKTFLLFLFCFIAQYKASSQQPVLGIEGDFPFIQQSLILEDKETGNIAIFIEDSDNVYGTLYNKNFLKLKELKVPNIARKFKDFFSYSIDGDIFTMYSKTNNDRSYATVSFDFENLSANSAELNFKLKGEHFISAVSRGQKMYMLTIPKGEDALAIYTFLNGNEPKRTTLNFTDTNFEKTARKNKITLYDYVSQFKGISSFVDAGVMKSEIPNSIESASKLFKVYDKNPNLILTIDRDPNSTMIITVDLDQITKKVEIINQIKFEKEPKVSNSFIHNNLLYQIAADRDNVKAQVVDINSKNILKTLEVNNQDEFISFANSPIIQEGGMYANYREMDKPSKFVRKIASGEAGITVFNNNGLREITLGSAKEIQKGGGFGMMGGMGAMIPIASIGNVAFTFNPTYLAYYGYTTTKSVRVHSLFDKDFNHIDQEITPNPFDRIKEFADEQKNIHAENVVKIGSDFYWGAYFRQNKTYKLFKFKA